MAKEMTREEKLWTMTGKTLLGVAEKLNLDVNKNILKQGKEKLIAKILEAEKKLENESNMDEWEQSANAEYAAREEQQAKNDKEAENAVNKPKRRGRTRTTKAEDKPVIKKEKTSDRTNLKIKELTYNGRTQTIREWAKELGMPWATLYDRVNRNGWSVEDAIEIPLGQRRK